MQPENESARLFHLLARYAYIQEIIERRKVLVLGQADAVLADLLEKQGIARALFLDPSAERVEEARRSCPHRRIEFEAGLLSRMRVPEGAFDVAIIDEFSALDDRSRELRAVRRALGASGVLIACTANPDAASTLADAETGTLSYYDFFGQLSDSFRYVRMVGQCPIVGFTLADLAVDSPETSITFDSSLLPEGSEDAEFFIAFCSSSPLQPDPFAVVQVPLSWVKLEQADTFPGLRGEAGIRPIDTAEVERLEHVLAQQADESAREITRLNLELDKRSVTIAKLENHLLEAREKAALEHNRVVQTKLALEAERKKFLSYTKEVEMDRRIQRIDATEDPEVARLGALKDDLEQRLAHAEEAAAYFEGRALGLAVRLADEQAAAQSLAARADTSRVQDLVADLAHERAERKLAETRAEELQQRLRAALTAGPRTTPIQDALRKAQAAFSGGSDSQAEIAALKAALEAEQETRRQLQERLEQLEQRGGGADAFRAELEDERRLRSEAETTIAQLEDKLSQAEAVAARLSSEGVARQRAEAAFGAIERAPVAGAALELELARERKARQEAQTALNRLKAERLDAVKLQDELDRCVAARLDLERRLQEERDQREKTRDAQPPVDDTHDQECPTDAPPPATVAIFELELERLSAELDDARAEFSRLEEGLRQKSLEVSELEVERERQADLLRQVLVELQVAQTRVPDLASELERREGELLEIGQRLRIAEDESGALSQQLAARDREVADLAAEVQGLKWRAAEDAASRGEVPGDPADIEKGRVVSVTSAHIAELERRVAHDEGRTTVLEHERERCREELRASRSEVSRLNAEIARLATELTLTSERRDAAEGSQRQTLARLLEAETRAAEALGTTSVLERELRSSKDEAGLLRQQLGAVEALREQALERCRVLEKDLQTSIQEASNATRDLDAVQACMATLEEEIPAISETLDVPLDLSLKAGSWTVDMRQTQVLGFPPPPPARATREPPAYVDGSAGARDPGGRLASTEQLLAVARAALDESDGRVAGLSFRISELEALQATRQATGTENEAMRAELEAAGIAFAQQEKILCDLRSRLGDIEGEVTRLESVRERLARRIVELEQELGQARDRVASLEFLQGRAEEWTDRLERAEQQGDRLRCELETARTELQRSVRVRDQFEDARKAIDGQAARLAELEDEKKAADEAIDRLMDHSISVGSDVEVLTELLSNREGLIEQLQRKLAQRDSVRPPAPEEPDPE
jgi:chromosome segregation ATPase